MKIWQIAIKRAEICGQMVPVLAWPVKTNVSVRLITFLISVTTFLHLSDFSIHCSNMSLLCPALLSLLFCFESIYIPTRLRANLLVCLPTRNTVLVSRVNNVSTRQSQRINRQVII